MFGRDKAMPTTNIHQARTYLMSHARKHVDMFPWFRSVRIENNTLVMLTTDLDAANKWARLQDRAWVGFNLKCELVEDQI
jgi:hypothetical protein